jgi:hypothetical protein
MVGLLGSAHAILHAWNLAAPHTSNYMVVLFGSAHVIFHAWNLAAPYTSYYLVGLFGSGHVILHARAFRLLTLRIPWSGFSAPYTQYSMLVLFGRGLKTVTNEDTQAYLATRNVQTMLLSVAPCQHRVTVDYVEIFPLDLSG